VRARRRKQLVTARPRGRFAPPDPVVTDLGGVRPDREQELAPTIVGHGRQRRGLGASQQRRSGVPFAQRL
jgi:hypothetical protein